MPLKYETSKKELIYLGKEDPKEKNLAVLKQKEDEMSRLQKRIK